MKKVLTGARAPGCKEAEHFGALGVQSVASHPGPGSYEAHPAGRMLSGTGYEQESPDPWGVHVCREGAIK